MPLHSENGLPLTESTFLILLSLAPGAKHGYAILKDVQALSRNRIRLSTGTLYGALDRLLTLGWIERMNDEEISKGERPHKSYQLTAMGRHLLHEETNRMDSLVSLARLHLINE